MRKIIVRWFIMGILAAAAFGVAPPARGAENEKDKKEPAEKAKADKPYFLRASKVTAVDHTAKTITVEGQEKSRTIQITSETRFVKGGKPATLDAVKVGDEVTGRLRKGASDTERAVTLRVGTEDAGKKKPKKEGEDKKKP